MRISVAFLSASRKGGEKGHPAGSMARDASFMYISELGFPC